MFKIGVLDNIDDDNETVNLVRGQTNETMKQNNSRMTKQQDNEEAWSL